MPMKNWLGILLLSCTLLLTGCSLFKSSLPPCDRTDVVKVKNAEGQIIMRIKERCYDRMLRDLDVCYKDGNR